jgi:hypothetical protein
MNIRPNILCGDVWSENEDVESNCTKPTLSLRNLEDIAADSFADAMRSVLRQEEPSGNCETSCIWGVHKLSGQAVMTAFEGVRQTKLIVNYQLPRR